MRYSKPLRLYNDVKEAGLCMLTLDTGTRFTGQSLTSVDLTTAYPYKTLNMNWMKKPHQLGSYLAKQIEINNVGGLLVGYSPIEDRALEIDHRERVLELLNCVHASPMMKDISFTLLNERGSTQNAKWKMGRNFTDDLADKRALNSFAAANFTQLWLDKVKTGDLYSDDDRIQPHLESVGDYWNIVHGA